MGCVEYVQFLYRNGFYVEAGRLSYICVLDVITRILLNQGLIDIDNLLFRIADQKIKEKAIKAYDCAKTLFLYELDEQTIKERLEELIKILYDLLGATYTM